MSRVQYNIGSIGGKNQSDMRCPGRPSATTEKVDQRIYKFANSDNIATTGDIQSVSK